MYALEHDKDITSLTTFGIPVKTRYFAEYDNVADLTRLTRSAEFLENDTLHIGGGSNLLFLSDFRGMVIHSAIKGIEIYRKNPDTDYIIAGAGVKWTDFVEWCLAHDYAGVENLAGIPGEVGASAVQNVGAYGVEAKDVIFSVECYDLLSHSTCKFMASECGFGYRDSNFKHQWKGRYIVLRVSFRLIHSAEARHLDYGPLASLSERLGHRPSISEVAAEVVRLRDSKLPNPAVEGSAGSFFKNPVVNPYFYEEEIKPYHPDLPAFDTPEGMKKLSAAWMIDHAGLKGKKIGGAVVYPRQPLVIANTGNATAGDVTGLADLVRAEVKRQFKVSLNPEVNYIDSSIHVTFLGSGTSKGIPEIGCQCKVCSSSDSHDKRLRASVLVETDNMRFLIDPGPDFRQQALAHGIDRIDAVLITHSHYDHVGGFDDLRPFCIDGPLDVFVRKDVDHDLRARLDYCFRARLYPGVPVINMHVITEEPFEIRGVKIIPIEVTHGPLTIFGYRIGDFAYITDAKHIEPSQLRKLEGVDTLVVNALRQKPHFSHFNLVEALRLIEEVSPRKAYLTHMCHDMPCHSDLEKLLPPNVYPAYDGLKLIVK